MQTEKILKKFKYQINANYLDCIFKDILSRRIKIELYVVH